MSGVPTELPATDGKLADQRAALAGFILGNLLASLVSFPAVAVISLLWSWWFWRNGVGFTVFVATFAILHLTGFLVGIWWFRKIACYAIPFVATTVYVFAYNCHIDGFNDSGPFGDLIAENPH